MNAVAMAHVAAVAIVAAMNSVAIVAADVAMLWMMLQLYTWCCYEIINDVAVATVSALNVIAIAAAMNNVAMIDVAAIAIVAAMNAVATVC